MSSDSAQREGPEASPYAKGLGSRHSFWCLKLTIYFSTLGEALFPALAFGVYIFVTGSNFVTQAGLELSILAPQPPQY